MTQGQWIRRVAKPIVFVAALMPFAIMGRDTLTGNLAAEPIKDLTHRTGLTTLVLLMGTLAVTPLRRLTGLNALVNLRRMVGLFAFFYATLHCGIYVADQSVFSGQGLSLRLVAQDVAKRPYITVGFTAFLMLVSLAVTSTKGWIRRLGGRRWQSLHRLVYVAAALGVLHFLWLVKADIRLPATYGVVLVALLAARLVRARRLAPRARGARPARRTSSDDPAFFATAD
jgi:sulfoxide reductase heme-binding subunit YedZ